MAFGDQLAAASARSDAAGWILAAIFAAAIVVVIALAARSRSRASVDSPVVTTHDAAPFDGPPFGVGDSTKGHSVVTDSVAGRAFESYVFSSQRMTTDAEGRRVVATDDWQVIRVFLPAPVPTIRMIADNPLFRTFAQMGALDIKVESHEFNQRWNLWSEDVRTCHAIFTPRMIERFLDPDLDGGSFIFQDRVLGMSRSGPMTRAQIESSAGALHAIVDLLPKFVFDGDADVS